MTTDRSESRDTLRHHGRSFHWAGRLLSRRQLENGALLYHLCRHLDDIADDAISTAQRQQAWRILAAFKARLGVQSPLGFNLDSPRAALDLTPVDLTPIDLTPAEQQRVEALISDANALFTDTPLAMSALHDLVSTMQGDLNEVALKDEAALLSYAYGAAGTVGVMMCPLIDAASPRQAMPFAMDLGMAMQMTNIARDVLEDAQRGRRYLPASWLEGSVTADAIADGDQQARYQAFQATRRLASLAEAYYASGWQGLGYLPTRPRLAIAVALRVYRQIGRRILTIPAQDYWSQRVVVPGAAKAWQSLLATPALLVSSQAGRRPRHDPDLHRRLTTSSCAFPFQTLDHRHD